MLSGDPFTDNAERAFRAFLEEATVPAVLLDQELQILCANAAFVEALGYTEAEVRSRPFRQLLVGHEIRNEKRLADLLGHAAKHECDVRLAALHGQIISAHLTFCSIPSTAPEERAIAFIDKASSEGIHSQLQAVQQQLELALRGADLGVWDWNIQTGHAVYNERWIEMLGVNRDEIGPLSWEHALHPEDKQRVLDCLDALIQGTTAFYECEYRIITSTGDVRWILARGRVVERDSHGSAVRAAGTHLDVTAEKQAKDSLRQAEDRLRLAQEAAGIALWDWDIQTGRLIFSEGHERLYAREPGSLTTVDQLLQVIHPDDRPDVISAIETAANEGRAFDREFRITVGRSANRWFRMVGRPVCDAGGRRIRVSGAIMDVTEQKSKDQMLAANVAALARSNEDLQLFARTVVHDLQQPLRMISSYTQLLENRFGDSLSADGKEFIRYARDGALRASDMLTALLAYARVGGDDPARLTAVNPDTAIAAAMANLSVAIEESGAVIEQGVLPIVRADLARLTQVFQNLIDNALKYQKQDEKPRIEITATLRHDECTIAVRDNGVGFPPGDVDRVFTIFKRSHGEEYPGTGVGLAVCKRIIEGFGGRIWAESEPGVGSLFKFSLPAG